MSDLVERLERSNEYEPLGHTGWEAAARITELEAENARLKEALEGALYWSEELASEDRSAYGHLRYGLAAGLSRARAALAGQGDGE